MIKKKLPGTETAVQLSLFSNPPPTDEKANESVSLTSNLLVATQMSNTQPLKIGSAKVEYVNSRSILKSPGGFIARYKFTLNPYSGCSFGCDYCYARFFAPSLDEQNDWGNWVKVKENAVALLRRARRSKSVENRLDTGDTIYMSTVTDPYQPIEHKVGLTRQILEELLEVQPRLTIQTRSPIALRDIDLFKKFKHIRVNFTISTDSEEVRFRYEPHCPAIEVRLKAAKQVAEAGVPIGISISPMLPIKDPKTFGKRIADLNADEYVTQFFKPFHSRFRAGTSADSIKKMTEDKWSEEDYKQVRNTLIHILGSHRPLLEGNEGYAPA